MLKVIEKFNTDNPDRSIPSEIRELRPNRRMRPIGTNDPLNVTWFDVHRVKNGFEAGTAGSHIPYMWYDRDHEYFYCHYSD